jgi:hypothetical protein
MMDEEWEVGTLYKVERAKTQGSFITIMKEKKRLGLNDYLK